MFKLFSIRDVLRTNVMVDVALGRLSTTIVLGFQAEIYSGFA